LAAFKQVGGVAASIALSGASSISPTTDGDSDITPIGKLDILLHGAGPS